MMAQHLTVPTPSGDRLAGGEVRIPMSYEEYLDWWDEGQMGEWVDGEVIVFMPPSLRHQQLVYWLVAVLQGFAKRHGLGEVIGAPFEMRVESLRSARQPDVLFVATANLDRLDDQRLNGPADLAIEVVSEHSGSRDLREKLAEYASAGVREYWVIDPRSRKRRVQLNLLTDVGVYSALSLGDDDELRSTVLRGLRLPISWLWQEPLPDTFESLAILIAPSQTSL